MDIISFGLICLKWQLKGIFVEPNSKLWLAYKDEKKLSNGDRKGSIQKKSLKMVWKPTI